MIQGKESIWALRAQYAMIISQMKINKTYVPITIYQNILPSYIMMVHTKFMQVV